jgi:3-hydroxybutyryl-CoA dehydratase
MFIFFRHGKKQPIGETIMTSQHGYYLEDLSVGMAAAFSKTITEDDITLFAEVSGDHNPVHMDEAFAKTTLFKTRIAHGLLSASFISRVLGVQLPGPGAIYLKQNLSFLAPVKIGDTVTAIVTITAIDPEKRRVTLDTQAIVAETPVIKGEALVMVDRRG